MLFRSALNGFGAQRANQLSTDIYATNKGTSCPGVTTAACISWLNNGTLGQAAAFAQPGLGTYGNLGILNVRGPAFFQFDTALTRQFRIREGQNLELRGEAFNLLNKVRFNNPAATLSTSATFGTIRSAQDPRILQFAMKYTF